MKGTSYGRGVVRGIRESLGLDRAIRGRDASAEYEEGLHAGAHIVAIAECMLRDETSAGLGQAVEGACHALLGQQCAQIFQGPVPLHRILE